MLREWARGWRVAKARHRLIKDTSHHLSGSRWSGLGMLGEAERVDVIAVSASAILEDVGEQMSLEC
jgi:hypothetical protein